MIEVTLIDTNGNTTELTFHLESVSSFLELAQAFSVLSSVGWAVVLVKRP